MTMLTQEDTATAGQIEQVTRVATDAIRKAVEEYFAKRKPSKDGAQRLHANGNVIVASLQEKLFAVYDDLMVTNTYNNEEAYSNYGYPKEYCGLKPIMEQVDAIAKAFDLSPDDASEWIKKVLPTLRLPEGAEGWCALPSVEAVAKRHFPEVTNHKEKYCRAVELVLKKLDKSRDFYNYHEGKIVPRQLRQHVHTLKAFEQITKLQKGDIQIIPVQYGMRHRGRCVRHTRGCFTANEFGLGAFAVGCMVLTHPKRYTNWEQLHTDCPGDEFSPYANGDFSESPFFDFEENRIDFGTDVVSHASGEYGSVTGFLPQ